MNNTELLKRGIERRIMKLGVESLCYAAQGDYMRAVERNNRKVELLLWLTHVIYDQAVERASR